MPEIRILYKGTLAELEPVLEKFKKMGIDRMDKVETIEDAMEVWESFQPWQRSKEFADAKERAKKRIAGDGAK